MVTKTRMTLEEYLALPQEPPYFEYLDGEVVQKPMPKRKHRRLAHEFDFALGLYRRRRGGDAGPEGHVWFEARHHWRVPDIVYWAPDKPQGDDDVALPPTLAVEILSPNQPMQDLRDKCRFYRANGVDAAWAVNPDTRTVEVFDDETDGVVLREGDTLTAAALPGFELSLNELFAVIDE
jgi:Uma2 family endonuclease